MRNIQWNWGTKLVIAMAAFMLMVLSMVFVMVRQDIELVEKDYYPRGQAHQQLIEKIQNTIPFVSEIDVATDEEKILISFPGFFKPESTHGRVHLYHRVNDKNDRIASLSLNESGVFTYPLSDLHGRYILKISWQQDGIEYYTEKNIIID